MLQSLTVDSLGNFVLDGEVVRESNWGLKYAIFYTVRTILHFSFYHLILPT